MKADDFAMLMFQISLVGVLIDQHATWLLIINALVWGALLLLAWALDLVGLGSRKR